MEIEKEIGKLLHAYQPACVLMTANKLRVFDALKSPTAADDVAQELSLSLKGTERLLNGLTALGIVVKEKGKFHLPAEWQKYLTQDGDHSMQQWIRLSADLLPVWLELPRFIQSGTMVKSIMDVLGNQPEEMRAFIDAMHDKGLKATWMLARELPIGDARKMLDVGGGPGTYALEWAKLHDNLKATVFDIPPVIAVAKDYIKRYGLEDRVDTRAGDFNKDDFGDGYDLILLANVIHMYDRAVGKNLIRKTFKSLEPGGRIVVHGFCTDEEQTAPQEDALFNLTMGMLTEGGKAHPVKEKIQWLEEEGFSEIRHFRVDAIPTGVITAVKVRN
ncbi:MAG: methyltransferase domain-containing protein [Nitrospinae bacterium]|nr:methyltransferase domain-containing protein [Nitrospinota bacterium]MCH8312819.1 methyltransferase domain-containing protein [Nitrospinota bacterium]